jgi:hypothetical protein
MGDPNHPHQREAFCIFQEAWLDLQEGQRHLSPPATDDIIKQTADKLAAAIVAKAEGSGVFLYSTLSAIVDHASQSPASLDLMLQAYVYAANKLPTSVDGTYGKGTVAAIGELNWWIFDEAGIFNPPLQCTQYPGERSAEDASNPQFQESDIKDLLSDILDRVQEWRQDRVRWTIMSAAMGRCYALDLVRDKDGKASAINQVDAALSIEGHRWSEAEFVGATIMLRACAKSLAADASKVSELVQKLEALFWGERVSFAIKSHSEVNLKTSHSRYTQLTAVFL